METLSIMLALNVAITISGSLLLVSQNKRQRKENEQLNNKLDCIDDNLNERLLGMRAEIKSSECIGLKTKEDIIITLKRELGGKTIKLKKKRKKKSGK